MHSIPGSHPSVEFALPTRSSGRSGGTKASTPAPNCLSRRAACAPTARLAAVSSLLLAILMGCATYQIGHPSLYRPDIRTVHVPVFESESLRRNLGERLTEAVIKEIEQRTPYKVVGSTNADSVLTGRITREQKRVVTVNRNNDARELETELMVEVRWANRRGDMLMQRGGLPLPQLEFGVIQGAVFLPEAGQSRVTSEQEVIERLARDIVGQMEIGW